MIQYKLIRKKLNRYTKNLIDLRNFELTIEKNNFLLSKFDSNIFKYFHSSYVNKNENYELVT